MLPLVKNAGAVLLGGHTSASIGDYWAGPSHTLPTAGAARFSSPLSVATFMKRTSVIYYSREAAAEAAEDVARFAEAEGFDAHARAARLRKQGPLPVSEPEGGPRESAGVGGGVASHAPTTRSLSPLDPAWWQAEAHGGAGLHALLTSPAHSVRQFFGHWEARGDLLRQIADIHHTPNNEARHDAVNCLGPSCWTLRGLIRVVNAWPCRSFCGDAGRPANDDLLNIGGHRDVQARGRLQRRLGPDLRPRPALSWSRATSTPTTHPATLNVLPAQPGPLRRRASRSAAAGCAPPKSICLREAVPRRTRTTIESLLPASTKIRQIFQEMFAGEHCERLYGFAPSLLHR